MFYPSLYSRGYRFAPDDQAKMDGFLGPFLNGRLKIEFIAVFSLVSFVLMISASVFLVFASNEELDAILAVPPWIWLAAAIGLAGLILVPIIVRLRSKIRCQLEVMGVEAREPPRPDFFMVDGRLSLGRLSYAVFAVSIILALTAIAAPKIGMPLGFSAFAFGAAITLLAADFIRK